tara:strand:- start:200 stop:1114 length:915 start_codon:yes stop_codon:yes gene_type:complete
MMSLSDLKKSNSNFDFLQKELEKIANPEKEKTSYQEDTRYWRAAVDKAGNGYAVVRFLPAIEGEELPWVRVFSHGFQGPSGRWYIENSLTTLGKSDPVSDANNELWNSGSEANKELARKRKRRLNYISNILVVKDPANPENEGKTFLFKYGKKIFDKINDVMFPAFADEQAINPFDFWKGANFKLKIRKVEGFTNYDKSEFESITELFEGDDDKIEAVWKAEHALQQFVDPSNFKPYEELKKKFDEIIGNTSGAVSNVTETVLDHAEKFGPAGGADDIPIEQPVSTDEKSDDAMSYFKKLAEQD